MREETLGSDVIGEALRAVRYQRVLSQRELAREVGVSKSVIGRLESGALPAAFERVVRLLEAVGYEVSLGPRSAAARPAVDVDAAVGASVTSLTSVRSVELADVAVPPPMPDEDDVDTIVAFWRQRVIDEQVRDAAGRRPPAHVHHYPIRMPHWWWVRRHPTTPWVERPLWSWSRTPTWPHTVLRLGRYPPHVGRPPVGGAPMQGHPPPEAITGAAGRPEWSAHDDAARRASVRAAAVLREAQLSGRSSSRRRARRRRRRGSTPDP